jgi:ATP-binding cassette subfamily F protein 3
MLHINDLTYRIGTRKIFDGATTAIPAGHKVGLVGRNGAGKSTLLRLIMGEIHLDSGSLHVRPAAKVMMVSQEAPDGPESLLETVLASNHELTSLEREAETATDPHRIAEIHIRLADIEAYTAAARAAEILAGLGFDEEAQARPCKSYSGGWRMRVALASALFNQPDLLLLDEPTNYLDLEGVLWLENFLKSYPYTILLVSHDRDLLNTAVTGILHLADGKLTYYTGNYDRFEKARREQMERQSALAGRQIAERQRIQSFVDRFRAKASKARQAQSRLKALARMEPIASVLEERTVPFHFPKPDKLAPPLIALDDVAVGYSPDKPVLRRLTIRIDTEDRIALLGPNGNGKSTFAKLISGRLAPLEGTLTKSSKLRVGYFAQHQLDELHPEETPYDHLAAHMKGWAEPKIRARLGAFGFGADKADNKVETLSGGEKARLLFALMSFAQPHVMILDEPTNHLDIDSREALAQAINEYEGAVILISHDRHLLEACVDRLLIVGDGTVKPYDGDLEDYRRDLLKPKSNGKTKSERPKMSSKDARREAAAARQNAVPLKAAAKKLEEKLETLVAERQRLERALGNPRLYNTEDAEAAKALADFTRQCAELDLKIGEAEQKWLEAQEAVEALAG